MTRSVMCANHLVSQECCSAKGIGYARQRRSSSADRSYSSGGAGSGDGSGGSGGSGGGGGGGGGGCSTVGGQSEAEAAATFIMNAIQERINTSVLLHSPRLESHGPLSTLAWPSGINLPSQKLKESLSHTASQLA